MDNRLKYDMRSYSNTGCVASQCVFDIFFVFVWPEKPAFHHPKSGLGVRVAYIGNVGAGMMPVLSHGEADMR